LSYKKGDPNCMTSEQAMKNIEIAYRTIEPRCIEAGGELNIGDKLGIVVFKGKKPEGFETI